MCDNTHGELSTWGAHPRLVFIVTMGFDYGVGCPNACSLPPACLEVELIPLVSSPPLGSRYRMAQTPSGSLTVRMSGVGQWATKTHFLEISPGRWQRLVLSLSKNNSFLRIMD